MRPSPRASLFAAAFTAVMALASCTMQEPSVVDPLDPEPVDADSLVIQPQEAGDWRFRSGDVRSTRNAP